MQLLPVGPWVRGFPKLQAMCLPGPYSDIRAFSGPTPSLKGSDHSRHQIRATAVLLVGVRGFSTGPCLLGTETMASWTRPLLHSYLPPQCWHRLPRAVVHSEAVFCPPCPSVCTQRGTNRAMGPRPAWSSGTHPRRSPRHPQASLPSSPSLVPGWPVPGPLAVPALPGCQTEGPLPRLLVSTLSSQDPSP